MKLLNNLENSHLDEIRSCLSKAHKAYFSIAFLKESGLNLLYSDIEKFLNKGGKIKVIAGLNFGLTDALALQKLFELFKGYSESYLYMYKGEIDSVFHPKFYLFENSKVCNIICGSANMTSGGVSDNDELSLSVTCSKNDDIWEKSITIFNKYIKRSDVATILDIDRYKVFQEKQKQARKNVKAFPQNDFQLNFNSLENYASEQQLLRLKTSFINRKRDYERAKNHLDSILNVERLTRNFFETHFLDLIQGDDKCWHSGSLARHKNRILDNHLHFRDLIKYIKMNIGLSPNELFESSIAIKKEKGESLKGVGVNYITEIMCTYNYKKFSVLNNNPFTVLTEKAGYLFSHKTMRSFSGQDYNKFCEVCKEVQERFGFKNLLEVDCFFNEIYWKIKPKK